MAVDHRAWAVEVPDELLIDVEQADRKVLGVAKAAVASTDVINATPQLSRRAFSMKTWATPSF